MSVPENTIPFVPSDFVVPAAPSAGGMVLQPLGPQHNERDYRAWTSSIDHIRATPGFEGRSWPRDMTIEQNLDDLVRHADDFRERNGFTYSVLIGDDVVGCVYIYPTDEAGWASVRSWVSAQHPELDVPLHDLVSDWLRTQWPFTGVHYAPRSPSA